jgi:tetratricopeptide (TPR) repeat protein
MLRNRLALTLVVVGVLLPLAWFGGSALRRELRYREVARLVPDLQPELLRHLDFDSDGDWWTYCRRAGAGALGDAMLALGQELRTPSYEQFRRRRALLEPELLRVVQGYNRAFDFPAVEIRVRHDRTLTDRASFELRGLESRYIEINSDTSRTPDERIRIVDDVVARFSAADEPYRALYASLPAIRFELERGRPDLRRARLAALTATARRLGEDYILCQLLGEMGDLHLSAGRVDSMAMCYDEGIALARRHGFIDQAARLLRFYAGYYAEQGRLALALQRFAEAERLCAMPGGERAQLRAQLEYTRFLANLGCWDLVARSLRRIPPLLRELTGASLHSEALKYSFDVDRLGARLAFAEGRVEEGSRLMRQVSSAVPPAHRAAGYAELFDGWSAGLESCGRFSEAIGICDRGIGHCDSTYFADVSLELQVRKARLLDRVGLVDSAERVLDRARPELRRPARAGGRVARDADVLGARLLLHRGRAVEAKREIERIFRQYRHRLGSDAGSSLSYLELDEAGSLRAAIHEIERFEPAEGYAFEMDWRSLARNLGGDRHAGSATPHGSGWPETRRLPPVRDAMHLVFWFDGERLLRWTARPDGVVLDTLPMTVTRCLAQVREALEWLQSEKPRPGDALGPKAFASLRSLSEALLPATLVADGRVPLRLEISPDGPLLALPFEALPAPGPRGPAPLALWADVAYVRGMDGVPRAATGPTVVLSNPTLPRDAEARYGSARSLPGSDAEAQLALARWPHAVLLSGDRATKESTRNYWPGASILYLAAHHVRDPDAPFLGFVPVAAPAGAPPDASLLEIADVHALDLSGCRLAVLASCSSGAPYRSAIRPGPSLGDAFLDSGARTVVGSFWDVGDDETRGFMKVFLATWREDGDDAAALGRARRAVMATPEGAAPRVWAAWSVMTTRR